MKQFELGMFLPVANNGWIMSSNSPQLMPTWDLNRRVTLLAEEIGFQYVFSMGKWRGLGGATKFFSHRLVGAGESTITGVETNPGRTHEQKDRMMGLNAGYPVGHPTAGAVARGFGDRLAMGR